MPRFTITAEMDIFLRRHYSLPAPVLTERFNREFNCNRTSKQVHAHRNARGLRTGRTGRFYPGQTRPKGSGAKSATSTSFQKGQNPHNTAKIGAEAITKDGYIKIKIAQPKTWKFKHHMVWEKAHGKISAGLVIWFHDQNRENCDLSNLCLIPRSLQVRFNKLQLNGQPEELRETLKLIAQLQHKAGETFEQLKQITNRTHLNGLGGLRDE